MQENREGNPQRENEPQQDYYQASRFAQEREALDIYDQLDGMFSELPNTDLFAYRFVFNHTPHVAVLGDLPSDGLTAQLIEFLLASGEKVELPENVLRVLRTRRAEASKQAP